MSASEKESDGITEKGSDQVSELNVYVINCDVKLLEKLVNNLEPNWNRRD